MTQQDNFWKLDHLSDPALLESLGTALHTKRKALAALIAHLGEVEERRLHLQAACSSMFDYCVSRLGMSEDEACRRIDVARLARRFPALFPLLSTGTISLSVARVLKPALSESNHGELFAAASGMSIRQARELLASRFPKPDVASTIRKLPGQRAPGGAPPAHANPAPLAAAPRDLDVPHSPQLTAAAFSPERTESGPRPAGTASPDGRETPLLVEPSQTSALPPAAGRRAIAPPPATALGERAIAPTPSTGERASAPPLEPDLAPATSERAVAIWPDRSPPPEHRGRAAPLSAGRYRVQFTADAELRDKLELARDLLRHAHPDGDFGVIFSRALDLLIADLLQRRFGVAKRRRVTDQSTEAAITVATSSAPDESSHRAAAPLSKPAARAPACRSRSAPAPAPTQTGAAQREASAASKSEPSAPPAAPPPPSSSSLPRATRRTVLERDGLGCSWVDGNGHRCGSRAWLEIDHRHPRGKGGDSGFQNLRLLCRAHNGLAAEQEYGRARVERARSARQKSAASTRNLEAWQRADTAVQVRDRGRGSAQRG